MRRWRVAAVAAVAGGGGRWRAAAERMCAVRHAGKASFLLCNRAHLPQLAKSVATMPTLKVREERGRVPWERGVGRGGNEGKEKERQAWEEFRAAERG